MSEPILDIVILEMTAEIASELWDYNPESGIFKWKVRCHTRIGVGDICGNLNNRGRLMLTIKRKKYQGSRIAWLMMTGKWPICEVDHVDGNQADNRWVNLRLATHGQNCQNQKLRIDNSLGVKGVHPHGSGFRASISFGGKRRSLGTFQSIDAAKAAYDAAAAELHGEFRRAA